MKAVIKRTPGVGIEIEEVPDPVPGAGQILVRPFMCGICGSDVSKFTWSEHQRKKMRLPVVLGHEFSGEVVALGEGTESLSVGDHVAIEPFHTCGHCYFCQVGRTNLCRNPVNMGSRLDGGMAELVAVSAGNALLLGKDVTPAEGAILEPLAVASHIVRRSGVALGDSVCIIGPGPIGLLVQQLVMRAGAVKVTLVGTQIDEHRLDLARSLGADTTLSTASESWQQEALERTGAGIGYDVVIECAGAPAALLAAFALVRPGGRVVVSGSFEDETVIRPYSMIKNREVEVVGSKGRHRIDWLQAIQLVEAHALDLSSFFATSVPLDQAAEGFELARAREALKVMVAIESPAA